MQLPMFDPIEVQLTKGYVALIDAIDVDLLSQKWQAASPRNRHLVYAANHKQAKNRSMQLLHRIVAERIFGGPIPRGLVVDHINGNTLDNTRANLRVCTYSENSLNAKRRVNASGFKGVDWHKNERKWRARIMVKGHRYELGHFDTPEQAYAAYCVAAQKYAGEFARLK